MKKFEKVYIGKGTQVPGLDIIKVVLPTAGLKPACFVMKDIQYLSFEVAKLVAPDKFGRTHTCYYSVKTDVPDVVAPKKTKKPKKPQAASKDLPF